MLPIPSDMLIACDRLSADPNAAIPYLKPPSLPVSLPVSLAPLPFPSPLHQNPLPHMLPVSSDMLIACDRWSEDPKEAAANGGFYMARSNDRVLRFFDYWLNAHTRFPGIHDQDAFMRVRPEADPYTRDTLRLSVHYLPTDLFGGFCEIGQRLGRLVTVHANCCFGLEEKMRVLQQVG
ncbi:unnamed protein product [Closterium sp. NIES-53]